MSGDVKSAVSAATLRLLRPLARFLLEARIGIGEFNALARLAYVQAAVQSGAAGGGYRPFHPLDRRMLQILRPGLPPTRLPPIRSSANRNAISNGRISGPWLQKPTR